jgi:hypothetical protein
VWRIFLILVSQSILTFVLHSSLSFLFLFLSTVYELKWIFVTKEKPNTAQRNCNLRRNDLYTRNTLRSQNDWLNSHNTTYEYQPELYREVPTYQPNGLSLVSTTEELHDRKLAASVKKTDNTALGIRHVDHVAPSIRKSWQLLRRHAAVARSV